MAMAKTRGTQARNRKPFMSAQEQASHFNAIKYSIYKTSDTPLRSRLCKEKNKYNIHCECVFKFG